MCENDKENRKEEFQTWVTFLPDKVIELKKKLPGEISDKLDLSIGSLDILEGYLLNNYTKESMINANNKGFVDLCASYFGLTFARNLPSSYWFIELEDQKDAFWGLPVIIVKDAMLAPFSPYNMVPVIFSRKKGNFLSTILNNSRNQINPDL